MDGADLTTPMAMHDHVSSRPTLGFPLGTALLLIIIFCLSGIFSFCYHWDKLRSLRRRQPHDHLIPTAVAAAAAANTGVRQDSIPASPSKLTSKLLQVRTYQSDRSSPSSLDWASVKLGSQKNPKFPPPPLLIN